MSLYKLRFIYNHSHQFANEYIAQMYKILGKFSVESQGQIIIIANFTTFMSLI